MKLKEYLTEKGMSMVAFGRSLGVTRQTVYYWTRGDNVPRPNTIAKIAVLTDGKVTPADFYDLPWDRPSKRSR